MGACVVDAMSLRGDVRAGFSVSLVPLLPVSRDCRGAPVPREGARLVTRRRRGPRTGRGPHWSEGDSFSWRPNGPKARATIRTGATLRRTCCPR